MVQVSLMGLAPALRRKLPLAESQDRYGASRCWKPCTDRSLTTMRSLAVRRRHCDRGPRAPALRCSLRRPCCTMRPWVSLSGQNCPEVRKSAHRTLAAVRHRCCRHYRLNNQACADHDDPNEPSVCGTECEKLTREAIVTGLGCDLKPTIEQQLQELIGNCDARGSNNGH